MPEKLYGKKLPDTLAEMEPLFLAVTHGCWAKRFEEALEVYEDLIERGEEYFSSYRLGAFGAGLSALSGFFTKQYVEVVEELSGRAEAYVYVEAGYCLRALGEPRQAITAVSEGLKRYEWVCSMGRAADCAYILSSVHLALGKLQCSLKYAKESVEKAKESGDLFREICALAILGRNYHEAGDLQKAQKSFTMLKKARQRYKGNWRPPYWIPIFAPCDFFMSQGDLEKARREASAIASIPKDKDHECLSDIAWERILEGLADLLSYEGGGVEDIRKTRTRFDEGVGALRKAALQDNLAFGLLGRAEYFRYAGDYRKGWADLGEAREIAERGEMGRWLADCCLEGARLCLAQAQQGIGVSGDQVGGDQGSRVSGAEAREREYRISNNEYRMKKEKKQRIVPFGGHEPVLMGGGEILAEARKYLEEAASEVEAMGYHRRDPEVLLIEAELLMLEGKEEEGKKVLDKAKARIEEMGFHRWDSEVQRILGAIR